ncbi:amidohydrolase family protein [Amycolatopsis pithecellobii]|uniref:Amidohydrolase family protein n=1 Tax=Amycolatopsis pithecellobii TaxID=664692 RepID=A0A6N7Z7U8_9PSEU|nr:amidohydrolase family protein [Amycolatopsis pithecellobii]MTD57444.1 amidohydrolase family protein [Amycolatopsis pithecellobii]
MREGATIFDNVVHIHNLSEDNVIEPMGRLAQNFFYRNLRETRGEGVDYGRFAQAWSAREVGNLLFHPGSQIDYAMVQTVPMFDLYVDGLDAVERQHELVRLFPDAVVFCGGTDPMLRGLNTAMHDLDHQIVDLGARSIKFYTAHTGGMSWRMDDPKVAFPMYERMLEHGVDIAQVHKGNPIGPEPLAALAAHDVGEAALAFPQMRFIIHHLGVPYEDETIAIAARYPNIYLSMSTWINFIEVAPRLTAERLGKALYGVGSDRILFGSEAPIGPDPQSLLDAVWNFQIPEDLREGYGYPAISDADRAKMCGGNLLDLLGMPPLAESAVAS